MVSGKRRLDGWKLTRVQWDVWSSKLYLDADFDVFDVMRYDIGEYLGRYLQIEIILEVHSVHSSKVLFRRERKPLSSDLWLLCKGHATFRSDTLEDAVLMSNNLSVLLLAMIIQMT
jgi:hypothetical protein